MDLLKCQERVKKQMALEYAPFAWSPEGRVYVKDVPCDDGLRVTVTFKKSPTSDGAVYVGIFAHEHGVGKFGNTTLHEPGSPIADRLASMRAEGHRNGLLSDDLTQELLRAADPWIRCIDKAKGVMRTNGSRGWQGRSPPPRCRRRISLKEEGGSASASDVCTRYTSDFGFFELATLETVAAFVNV